MAVQRVNSKSPETLNFNLTTWDKVRDKVKSVNPKLGNIIDELNPNNEYTLIHACYPYGINIRKDGENFYPTDTGCLATLDDPTSAPILKSLLSYSSSPLGLVLDKSVEVYAETPNGKRSIPFKVFYKGTTFGVWEIMDFPKVTLRQNWTWNISSGIRTLFMLPSISETTSHTRLRHECGVRSYVPDTIFGHHEIFKDIVHNSNANWHTEILFFTKKWLEPCENNSGWVKLQEYWTKEAWWQFQYWANRVVLNLNWEEFIAELSHRKIKLASYLLDTIKQLISIATGTITGFRVCDNSETIAPTNIIEDAYLNIYSLRKYAPLIMHPDMLLPNNTFSRVYYSLQYPTLPEKPTDLKNFPSVMKMMRQLKSLMDIFLNIMEKYKPITEKNLLDFNNCVDFSYFHSECDKFNIAKPTKVLFQEDQLLKDALKKFKQKTVPENSHFLRGCVRISLEKN